MPPAGAPDHETAPAFPFAQTCATEAMRLHPVAPLHYFEACRDTTLGDVLLPKGTYLFCLTRLGATGRVEMWRGDGRSEHRCCRPFRLAVPYEPDHGSVSTSRFYEDLSVKPFVMKVLTAASLGCCASELLA